MQQFETGKGKVYTAGMRYELTLDAFVERLKAKKLTDKRTGKNGQYEIVISSATV